MPCEISQTEKNKYRMASLNVWNLKKNVKHKRVDWWLPGAVGWGRIL